MYDSGKENRSAFVSKLLKKKDFGKIAKRIFPIAAMKERRGEGCGREER